MEPKVIHITRKRLDRREADVRALWENVLKPKWEKRFRARAEGLVTKLTRNERISPPEFTTRQEVLKSVVKIEIVIVVSDNNLIIRCGKSNGDKKQ